MFFFVALLQSNEIIPAIQKLRTTRGREQDTAFLQLVDRYIGVINSVFARVSQVAESEKERREVKKAIETIFAEILMSPQMKLDNPAQVTAYINHQVRAKASLQAIREALGKGSAVTVVEDYKTSVNNAIKRFFMRFHKYPDFREPKDKQELANSINVSLKQFDKMLVAIGPKVVQSLSESVGGEDDEGNVASLLESMKSDEPLPDKVYEDDEFIRALKGVMKTHLSPDEQKVFSLYFLDEDDRKLTKEDIAKELNKPLSTVRNWLALAESKMKDVRVVRELRDACQISRMVKQAQTFFTVVKRANSYKIVKVAITEKIVAEFLNG